MLLVRMLRSYPKLPQDANKQINFLTTLFVFQLKQRTTALNRICEIRPIRTDIMSVLLMRKEQPSDLQFQFIADPNLADIVSSFLRLKLI